MTRQPPFAFAILQNSSSRPPAKKGNALGNPGRDGTKAGAGAKSNAKAPRLCIASDVQLAAQGHGNRHHGVDSNPVLDRIGQDAARRQLERTNIIRSQPQVAVPILTERQGSATWQSVVFGPYADRRSIRGKLSQILIHAHPDVAFSRLEDVENAPSWQPVDPRGETFESIPSGARSGNGPVEVEFRPHPDPALSVYEEMRDLGVRQSRG